MVVYTEGGVLYRVRWATTPWVVRQSDGAPALKLVAIRLAGDRLQVAVEAPAMPMTWADPKNFITEDEAALWAKRGFEKGGKSKPV